MKSKYFLSITFIIIALVAFPWAKGLCQTKPSPYSAMATDVLKLINEHRVQIKRKPLVMNETISAAAIKHSDNMATGAVEFGHDGFDERIEGLRKKIKQTNSWAENVAYGAKTAQQVVKMWLNSPEHKENIEGNYNLTGIGIVKGRDGNLYFTQIFCNSKMK